VSGRFASKAFKERNKNDLHYEGERVKKNVRIDTVFDK
jgi:hypothetical protein